MKESYSRETWNREDGAKVCALCCKPFDRGWRCKSCWSLICDDCSKGGKSSGGVVALRWIAGIYTLGLSEAARAGYRKSIQKCPKCDNSILISI